MIVRGQEKSEIEDGGTCTYPISAKRRSATLSSVPSTTAAGSSSMMAADDLRLEGLASDLRRCWPLSIEVAMLSVMAMAMGTL